MNSNLTQFPDLPGLPSHPCDTPSRRRKRKRGKDEEKEEIVLDQSQEKLAEAVLGLLTDQVLTEKYRKHVLERARDFSKEAYLKRLLSCIDTW